MQTKLLPILTESTNAVAFTKKGSDRPPIARKHGLREFPIASSKSEWSKARDQFIGYRTSSGRIYLSCPFHKEKTPSCVVFFKGDGVPHHPSRWNHYSCFGCGKFGSIRELCHGLRTLPRERIEPLTGHPIPQMQPLDPDDPLPF